MSFLICSWWPYQLPLRPCYQFKEWKDFLGYSTKNEVTWTLKQTVAVYVHAVLLQGCPARALICWDRFYCGSAEHPFVSSLAKHPSAILRESPKGRTSQGCKRSCHSPALCGGARFVFAVGVFCFLCQVLSGIRMGSPESLGFWGFCLI